MSGPPATVHVVLHGADLQPGGGGGGGRASEGGGSPPQSPQQTHSARLRKVQFDAEGKAKDFAHSRFDGGAAAAGLGVSNLRGSLDQQPAAPKPTQQRPPRHHVAESRHSESFNPPGVGFRLHRPMTGHEPAGPSSTAHSSSGGGAGGGSRSGSRRSSYSESGGKGGRRRRSDSFSAGEISDSGQRHPSQHHSRHAVAGSARNYESDSRASESESGYSEGGGGGGAGRMGRRRMRGADSVMGGRRKGRGGSGGDAAGKAGPSPPSMTQGGLRRGRPLGLERGNSFAYKRGDSFACQWGNSFACKSQPMPGHACGVSISPPECPLVHMMRF